MLKVGDKVICIKTSKIKDKFIDIYKDIKYPKVGSRYTIDGFHHYSDSKYISVRLVEIKNDVGIGVEIHFPIRWFELENTISIEKELIKKELILN